MTSRRPRTPSSRSAYVLRRLLALLAVVTMLGTSAAAGAVAAPAAAPATCVPGSGRRMPEHHFTAADIGVQSDFRCADLREANLVGLSLTQVDFRSANLSDAKLSKAELGQAEMAGANLSGTDLSGTDLVQATLTGAVLVGADLSGARMGQVEAGSADFTNANLTGADLTQAELTNARLDGADLEGTDFTQATLTNTGFAGATGLPRWDLYLLFGCVALFLLLAVAFLASIPGRRRRGAGSGRMIAVGLLGRLVIVLGIHLFLGSLIGLIGSSFGGPIIGMCSGPQCAVGIGTGMWAPFVGVGLVIVGILIAVAGRSRIQPPPPAPFEQLAHRP